MSQSFMPRLRTSDTNMQILYLKSRTVDLGRVGMIATSLNDFYINDAFTAYLQEYMNYGVAMALLQGIGGGQIEAALEIKEISPFLDLVDGNGRKIENNQWIQTNETVGDHLIANDPSKDSVSVYQTSKLCKNDQKVYLIYGFEFMNGYRNTNIDEIQIWRKHIQLLNRIPIDKNKKHPLFKGITYEDGLQDMLLEDLDEEDTRNKRDSGYSVISNKKNLVYHNNIILLQTPVLMKKDYILDIRFVYRNGHAPCLTKVNEEIKIKGLVFESLGQSCCG